MLELRTAGHRQKVVGKFARTCNRVSGQIGLFKGRTLDAADVASVEIAEHTDSLLNFSAVDAAPDATHDVIRFRDAAYGTCRFYAPRRDRCKPRESALNLNYAFVLCYLKFTRPLQHMQTHTRMRTQTKQVIFTRTYVTVKAWVITWEFFIGRKSVY